jgi:dipeptidyl-peptidase-3
MAEPEYLCPTGFEVGDLHVDEILQSLSPAQQKYATYLSLATWSGFSILANQVSLEGGSIHSFLYDFLLQYPRAALEAASTAGPSPLSHLIDYAAVFYTNGGNYLGFGDSKFIPRITREELLSLVADYPSLRSKLDACIDSLYDIDPSSLHIGFHPGGATALYQPREFRQDEQKAVDALLQQANIGIENTIIHRLSDKYVVKQFSITIDEVGRKIGDVEGKPVYVTKGHESEALTKVVHWLKLARDSALNPGEIEMLNTLINHYETGDLREHIRYSELWVGDVDPVIENYHGFIETYRDPAGVRAEFESFVAALNPSESEFLHKFVSLSSTVLPLLPYPPCYERSNFIPPSYNAINLLTLCSSLTPAGINIPNYDEIRLNKGFKNVSLTNVTNSATITASKFPFLTDDVIPAFVAMAAKTGFLGVAAHELYGHGSGRLFTEADVANNAVPDIIFPGRFVTTFYAPGETFTAVFGACNGSYEECRAETSAMHLAFKDEVLDMYGVAPEDRQTFKFVFVLNKFHAAIRGLTMYVADVLQWKQPHSRARFAMLRAAIIWGRGAVAVRKIDGQYKLIVDQDKFDGIVDAIELLLKHLNYYKTARLPEQGREFYAALTSIDDFWMDVRKAASDVKTPRTIFAGSVVRKVGEEYTLVRCGGEKPTALDAALAIVESIKVALE